MVFSVVVLNNSRLIPADLMFPRRFHYHPKFGYLQVVSTWPSFLFWHTDFVYTDRSSVGEQINGDNWS